MMMLLSYQSPVTLESKDVRPFFTLYSLFELPNCEKKCETGTPRLWNLESKDVRPFFTLSSLFFELIPNCEKKCEIGS